MYVAKFLAINLELDPPDCAGLGEDPEDVSTFPFRCKALLMILFFTGQNRGIYRVADLKQQHAELP